MKTAVRPLYRPFDAVVRSIVQLSPSFIRITFGGVDLNDFWPEGVDQRLKLILPNNSGEYPDFTGDDDGWYPAWRALPEDSRPPMRTYTVRSWRRSGESLELDIDFVVHCGQGNGGVSNNEGAVGKPGPVSRWLPTTTAGDRVKIVGPDAVSGGPWASIGWNPPAGTTRYLLAGDETAAPAIAAILETLPAGCSARAFIEVPFANDHLDVALPAGAELTWLAREDRPHGSRLSAAVRAAFPVSGPASGPASGSSENTDVYTWIAGESSVITALRRHLVRDAGLERNCVTFMGYWRAGAAEN